VNAIKRELEGQADDDEAVIAAAAAPVDAPDPLAQIRQLAD